MAQVSTKKNPPGDLVSAAGSISIPKKAGRRRSVQNRTKVARKQANGSSSLGRAPTDILAARLCYAELYGWESFPAPPGSKKSHKSGKHSNGQRWGASNKPSVIERDFRRWPKANIGIPTGFENGFWVLEADTPKGHDVDGIASLRALERKYGRLPKTLMAISPSGSLHYYFRYPKRGLVICNSASKVAPGVDVRGAGGMVLAPPSIKEGVGRYRWLNWGTRGADAPKWLLDLVVRKPRLTAIGNGMSLSNGMSNGASNPFSSADDADIKLIKAALAVITEACIDCNKWPYQVWFEIGCALCFELGDAGFELFDAWSAVSPNYNKQQCIAKWKECANPKIYGHYKIGTILHYANEASPGWRSVYQRERLIEAFSFGRRS